MTSVIIDSSNSFITYGISGEPWTNFELSGNIALTTNDLNNANDLYKGFDGIFDFCGNTITITQLSGPGQNLNKALFMDLSGGTLKNLNLVLNDITFDASFYGGVLVGGDSSGNYSYGDISNVYVEANNVIIEPAGYINSPRSLTLPPNFAKSCNSDINITGIDISGTGVNKFFNTSYTNSYGLLMNTGFEEYSGTASISDVVNRLNFNAASGSIFGELFGKSLAVEGEILVSNCANYGDISGFSSSGLFGQSAGQYNAGHIMVENCVNHGVVRDANTGIIYKLAHDHADGGTFDVSGCINYGDIFGDSGIVGANANISSSGNFNVLNCENHGYVKGNNYSTGIIGSASNVESVNGSVVVSHCINYGDISGTYCSGIIGGQLNSSSDGTSTILIEYCDNSGSIRGEFSSGIVGPFANDGSRGGITIDTCQNTGIISGPYCSGIVGSFANYNALNGGTILVRYCINNGNVNRDTAVGIVGSVANYSSSGFLYIFQSINYGSLTKSFYEAGVKSFNTDMFPFFHDVSYYTASSGIVGIGCGSNQTSSGNTLIEECENHGSFEAPYTAGIVSFALGYESAGTIDISGCVNYAELKYTGCSGISCGLVGINNTGTITFNQCNNHGDISGVTDIVFTETYNQISTGCLIHSIGYVNDETGEESCGDINIMNCNNDNSCRNVEDVTVGGIIGQIFLPRTKQLNIDVSNCVNNFNDIDVSSNTCLTGGICVEIVDNYNGEGNLNNIISIHNCLLQPLSQTIGNIIDSKIFFSFASQGLNDHDTPCTINIYDNQINCSGLLTSTCFVSAMNFTENVDLYMKNKSINIFNNAVQINVIDNDVVASMFLSVKAFEDCNIDICGNEITIESIIGNVSNVSGILSEDVEYIVNSDILIRNNTITINDIDTLASNIAGLIRVNTIPGQIPITPRGTFFNCSGFNLTITDNDVISNTITVLNDFTKGNAALIGTNTDINPTGSSYVGPTGQLVINGNTINGVEESSDYYVQPNFRPYIFVVSEYPGSNYWFGKIKNQHEFKTDDSTLRQIFKRAIKAINEQTRFEIYPFYHIKVKGKAM